MTLLLVAAWLLLGWWGASLCLRHGFEDAGLAVGRGDVAFAVFMAVAFGPMNLPVGLVLWVGSRPGGPPSAFWRKAFRLRALTE